jgi:hypothetical protein
MHAMMMIGRHIGQPWIGSDALTLPVSLVVAKAWVAATGAKPAAMVIAIAASLSVDISASFDCHWRCESLQRAPEQDCPAAGIEDSTLKQKGRLALLEGLFRHS